MQENKGVPTGLKPFETMNLLGMFLEWEGGLDLMTD